MKASGTIFTTIQKPFTAFGVPPKLLVLVAAAATPVYAIFIMGGLMAIALPAMLLIMVGGGVFLWRKNREDCHFEQVLLIGLPFFKGKSSRHLLCGSPKKKPYKKESAY